MSFGFPDCRGEGPRSPGSELSVELLVLHNGVTSGKVAPKVRSLWSISTRFHVRGDSMDGSNSLLFDVEARSLHPSSTAGRVYGLGLWPPPS